MLACTVWSQPAPSDPAAEVLALEPKIEDAVVRGDVAFVDSVLAPDFSFVHGDGWTLGGKPLASDDKAAFLKRVADKEYLVHDLDGVKAEVHGDIVITYGRYLSLYMPKPQNAIPNATPGKLNSIWFERIYAKRNGQWQFADKRYKLGATTMGAGQCPSLRLMSIFGWLSAGRAEDLRREFRADDIRLSSKDLEAIQKRALAEGLPYQTLIASLLHKYASGRLKEI